MSIKATATTSSVVVLATVWGALGVAYTAMFGGEAHPPGVLVAVGLGAAGACAGAWTWALWWGLSAVASPGSRERRAVAYAFGRSVRRAARDDLREWGVLLLAALVWGAAGGLAAATAWSVLDGTWSWAAQSYDLSARGFVVLVVQALVWAVAGYVLGLIFRRVERALAAVAGVAFLTFGLLALAYFNSGLAPLVAVSPFALPLTLVGGVAGPYTALPSRGAAAVSLALWCVALVAGAWFSARRPLLDDWVTPSLSQSLA